MGLAYMSCASQRQPGQGISYMGADPGVHAPHTSSFRAAPLMGTHCFVATMADMADQHERPPDVPRPLWKKHLKEIADPDEIQVACPSIGHDIAAKIFDNKEKSLFFLKENIRGLGEQKVYRS